MRNYIQRFKSFFIQIVSGGRTVVTLKGDQDFAVAAGARLGMEGAAGDTYLVSDAVGSVSLFVDGNQRMRAASSISFFVPAVPNADNTIPLGELNNRWTEGVFSAEVGIHDGTNFTHSFTATGITIAEQVNVITADAESVIIGDVDHALQLPVMTTSQRNALAPQDGMMLYNSDDNEVQARINGAWRKLDDAAAGS